MKDRFDRYFLAANSFEGFKSFFDTSYSAENGFDTYIIKGGPGTGKSSFMKYIALKAIDFGFKVHLCHCSSDPDSLDGIIIDEKRIVILDGTSPHTVEPKYPGVCENIIDLGAFWNTGKLKAKRMEIINAANINKTLQKTAALYLSVCGEIERDTLRLAGSFTKRDKVLAFAERTAKCSIPRLQSKKGSETLRFLSGITPKGIMSFQNTITDNAENVIVLEDKYGAFSGIAIDYIKKYATDCGYDIITLKSPFLPSVLTDHIIIPRLSLAIVTENEYLKFPSYTKKIHLRRFTDIEQKNRVKSRLLFNGKIKNNLLYTAVNTLKKAKASHDCLEKYYIESMDFKALEKYTEDFCDNLFKNNTK